MAGRSGRLYMGDLASLITVFWPVLIYTAWWKRHILVICKQLCTYTPCQPSLEQANIQCKN